MSSSALVNVSFPKPGVADCSIIAGKEIEKFPARRVQRPKSMRATNLPPRIVSINSELRTANLCIKVTQQNVFFAILNAPQCSSLILGGLENVGAYAENIRNRSLSENFKRTLITRDTHHARMHAHTNHDHPLSLPN